MHTLGEHEPWDSWTHRQPHSLNNGPASTATQQLHSFHTPTVPAPPPPDCLADTSTPATETTFGEIIYQFR